MLYIFTSHSIYSSAANIDAVPKFFLVDFLQLNLKIQCSSLEPRLLSRLRYRLYCLCLSLLHHALLPKACDALSFLKVLTVPSLQSCRQAGCHLVKPRGAKLQLPSPAGLNNTAFEKMLLRDDLFYCFFFLSFCIFRCLHLLLATDYLKQLNHVFI